MKKSSLHISSTTSRNAPVLVISDYALIGFCNAYALALVARASSDARVVVAVIFSAGVVLVVILHHWYPVQSRVAMLLLLLSVGVALI